MFYRWIPKICSTVVFFSLLAFFLNVGSQAVIDLGEFFANIQVIPALLRGTVRSILLILVWVVLTIGFGRVYCSMFCPMGLLQQLCARRGRQLIPRSHTYRKPFLWVRYSFFALFLATCVGTFVLKGKEAFIGFLRLIDPFSFFERLVNSTVSYVVALSASSSAQSSEQVVATAVSGETLLYLYGILLLILLVAFFFGRVACNYFCPIGIVTGILSRLSFFRIHIKGDSCVNCRRCAGRCTSGCIKIKDHTVDIDRCMLCGSCLKDCPKSCIFFGIPHSDNSAAGSSDEGQDED